MIPAGRGKFPATRKRSYGASPTSIRRGHYESTELERAVFHQGVTGFVGEFDREIDRRDHARPEHSLAVNLKGGSLSDRRRTVGRVSHSPLREGVTFNDSPVVYMQSTLPLALAAR